MEERNSKLMEEMQESEEQGKTLYLLREVVLNSEKSS
jgi:hypothetical protein